MGRTVVTPEDTVLRELMKGPKPSIPVDWIWKTEKSYVDEKGAWYVEGHCTTYDLDFVGDEITKEFAEEVADQMVGLTVLHNHDPDKELGKCVSAGVDEVGIWVKCLISKACPVEWTKITEGILSKFSIRFLELKATPKSSADGTRRNMVQSGIVTELSLTSLPMNRAANGHLAYVGKSLDGGIALGAKNASELMKGLEVFSRASAKLVSDYKAGKLKSFTPELRKQEGSTHTVVEGETATAIAEQYGITVDALLSANGLGSAEEVVVGAELTIPAPEEVTEEVPEEFKQEEPVVPEVAGPSNADFGQLEALVVQLADLVKKLAVGVPKAVEAAITETITPVVAQVAAVEEQVAEVAEEAKSLGAVRQSIEGDDEPVGDGGGEVVKVKSSMWDGTTPVDRSKVKAVMDAMSRA